MGEDIVVKYSGKLAELKINSKPLINLLTMMAEDYIRHAPVIVQVIEKHLATVKPEIKLPALYLVDSIIKNVKKEYIGLFTQNIVSTFCGVFEKADEKTRGLLYKLRQTWTEQFPGKKLYAIDIRCHDIDPKWPILAPKPQSGTIHVNPRFLNMSKPVTTAATSGHMLVQPVSIPSVTSLTTPIGSSASDVEMQAEYLAKQRELIELQEKKLQLELLQTQLKIEEQARLQKEESSKQMDIAAQQKMLLDKAEKAKKNTERAKQQLSLNNLPHKSSSHSMLQHPPVSVAVRNSPSSKYDSSSDRESHGSSSRTHRTHAEASNSSTESSPTKKSSKSSSRDKDKKGRSSKSKDRQESKEKDSRRDRHTREKDRHRESSRSGSKDKTREKESKEKVLSSPTKTGGEWKRYEAAKKLSPPKRSHKKDSEDEVEDAIGGETKARKRSPSPSIVPKSPVKFSKSHHEHTSPSKSPSSNSSQKEDSSSSISPLKRKIPKNKAVFVKEQSKEREISIDSEDKTNISKPVLSDPRLRRKLENATTEDVKNTEEDSKDYRERQLKVLRRNYRKQPGIDTKEDSNTELDSIPMDVGSSPSTNFDFRFDGHNNMDVDLRSEPEEKSEPPTKRTKQGSEQGTFEDLFGHQDVDLRAGSSWTQVKSEERGSEDKKLHPRAISAGRDISNLPQRPPVALSPTDSIGSASSASTCDPLGRPLVYSRLPNDPEERKRSLDSRSNSIDPITRFKNTHVDNIVKATGELSESNMKLVCVKAKDELDQGLLSSDEYIAVMKQLLKIHEATALRDAQMKEDSWHLMNTPGPNPWITNPPAAEQGSNNIWAAAAFGAPMAGGFPNRFAGPNPAWVPPVSVGGAWVGAAMPLRPTGPNPFEEAIARPLLPSNAIPKVNLKELHMAEQEVGNIPIDKIQRQVRFYRDTTIVFMGAMNDDPRELTFQRDDIPRTVLINNKPLEVFLGVPKKFDINRVSHVLRIGTPGRELCIDDHRYELFFGGPPKKIQVDGRLHTFQLLPPTPQVSVGQMSRYDLCAGRLNLVVNASQTIPLFLDERPQKIELLGEPVVARFVDGFQGVSLNGKIFPTNFGSPFSVILSTIGTPQHLRFSTISQEAERAIQAFLGGEWGDRKHFGGRGGGRGAMIKGGRGRGGGIVRGRGVKEATIERIPGPNPSWGRENSGETPSHMNKVDLLNSLFQASESNSKIAIPEHSYESVTATTDKNTSSQEPSETEANAAPNVNVGDLVANLIKYGLLPSSAPATTESSSPGEPVEEDDSSCDKKLEKQDEDKSEPSEEPKPVIQPLPTVDLSFTDNLKERRDIVIAQISTGVQCSQCGLRFAPDQTIRYSQHLDWHFRQNRRDKENAKKALSRKWYYDLSDWIQFEEVEDLEERAASLFESQDIENEGDAKSPGATLNPDDFTVLASSHEGAACPQCGEQFESFFDEEREEWRLKNAKIDDYEGVEKVYHPICHQDYLRSLVEESVLEDESPHSVESAANNDEAVVEAEESENVPKLADGEEDDDEVLILKEGKKEVVVEEIDIDDDDIDKNDNQTVTVNIVANEDEKNVVNMESKTDENDSIINNKNNINVENDNNGIVSISTLSDNIDVTNNSVHSPIIIDEDSTFLPGLNTDSNGGVFGFALGSDKEVTIRQPLEEDEGNKIIYESMKFDFPPIKLEPPDEDEMAPDEQSVVQDETLMAMNNCHPTPAASGESVPMNIDLTEEDSLDAVDSGARLVTQIRTSIDGNLQHEDASAALPFIPASKIRINISGVDTSGSSGSPKEKAVSSPQPAQNMECESEKSESQDLFKDDGSSNKIVSSNKEINKDSNPDELVLTDEMKLLKPRLVGRKLKTYPPKFKGKEESGLCVIC